MQVFKPLNPFPAYQVICLFRKHIIYAKLVNRHHRGMLKVYDLGTQYAFSGMEANLVIVKKDDI